MHASIRPLVSVNLSQYSSVSEGRQTSMPIHIKVMTYKRTKLYDVRDKVTMNRKCRKMENRGFKLLAKRTVYVSCLYNTSISISTEL